MFYLVSKKFNISEDLTAKSPNFYINDNNTYSEIYIIYGVSVHPEYPDGFELCRSLIKVGSGYKVIDGVSPLELQRLYELILDRQIAISSTSNKLINIDSLIDFIVKQRKENY